MNALMLSVIKNKSKMTAVPLFLCNAHGSLRTAGGWKHYSHCL